MRYAFSPFLSFTFSLFFNFTRRLAFHPFFSFSGLSWKRKVRFPLSHNGAAFARSILFRSAVETF